MSTDSDLCEFVNETSKALDKKLVAKWLSIDVSKIVI